jgi:hypothetical protein
VSYALRLFGDVGRWLKSEFNKIEEGGYELAEMVSATVPLSGGGSAALPRQHCPPCLLSS